MTEKRKKVLFVATVDSHIELFHLPYLKMFRDRGYEVHVATESDKPIKYCDKKIKLPIKRSPFKAVSNLKAVRELKKVMKQEDYAIVHCHTPVGGVVARMAGKKARRNGTRMIYTAHGFHFYKGAPVHYWLMFYPVEKYLAKYTDTLITINQEDYERAKKKFGKRCHDIQYVPGVGVDEKKFAKKMTKEEKKELRKELGIEEKDYVIIFPAELSKRKNQEWLIETLVPLLRKGVNGGDCYLLLPGSDSLNGKCQALAKNLGVESKVQFLGFRTDIPNLLQISDVAVSSARQEGLPVNLMEATMFELPIVATDCRGNRDICEMVGVKPVKQGDGKSFRSRMKKAYAGSENNKVSYDYGLSNVIKVMADIYKYDENFLIIPECTDLNRGDQALVLETKNVIESVWGEEAKCYMMGRNNMEQCKSHGVYAFSEILEHPSRFDKNGANISYGLLLKLRWGVIACFDFLYSFLLLNSVTRSIVYVFSCGRKKQSLRLYRNAKAIFVKGGGFLHDYSGGPIGLYTIYYQVFHIKLALAMHKKVFIMPNSFGPFSSKRTRKIVNSVLDKCEIVTARESISASGKTNGLMRDIELLSDLAFYMDKKAGNKGESLLEKNGINLKEDKLVAITARPYRFYKSENPLAKYEGFKDGIRQLIASLQKSGYKVLLVVHTRAENDHENDEHCIDEIITGLSDRRNVYKIKDDKLDCYDLKQIYGHCDYVVGTRFHSVIFSLQQFVPCIAITYGGNKGAGIMKDIGLSKYAIAIDHMNGDKLVELFDNLSRNNQDYKDKISKYLVKAKQNRGRLINEIEVKL